VLELQLGIVEDVQRVVEPLTRAFFDFPVGFKDSALLESFRRLTDDDDWDDFADDEDKGDTVVAVGVVAEDER